MYTERRTSKSKKRRKRNSSRGGDNRREPEVGVDTEQGARRQFAQYDVNDTNDAQHNNVYDNNNCSGGGAGGGGYEMYGPEDGNADDGMETSDAGETEGEEDDAGMNQYQQQQHPYHYPYYPNHVTGYDGTTPSAPWCQGGNLCNSNNAGPSGGFYGEMRGPMCNAASDAHHSAPFDGERAGGRSSNGRKRKRSFSRSAHRQQHYARQQQPIMHRNLQPNYFSAHHYPPIGGGCRNERGRHMSLDNGGQARGSVTPLCPPCDDRHTVGTCSNCGSMDCQTTNRAVTPPTRQKDTPTSRKSTTPPRRTPIPVKAKRKTRKRRKGRKRSRKRPTKKRRKSRPRTRRKRTASVHTCQNTSSFEGDINNNNTKNSIPTLGCNLM